MSDAARTGRGRVVRALHPLLPSAMKVRLDAWENTLTGLGSLLRDKRTAMRFALGPTLADAELEAMYRDDDLAALIVDVVPDEALRQGYRITIDADEDSDAAGDAGSAEQAVDIATDVFDFAETFSTIEKMNEAWRWGRLYGGAALYMGVDDGAADQAEPLRENTIRRVRFLHVVDKQDIQPIAYFDDPDADNFGQPSLYRITATTGTRVSDSVSIDIHASRLIVFPGARTTKRERVRNNGWDVSVLQRLIDVLRDFQTAWGSIAHVLGDANQGVFKIKGLIEMIGGGLKDVLATRMEVMDQARSVVRSILLDADGEDFERLQVNLGGYPQTLDRFMMRLSAATGIPVTLLMGRSPAGENATGESDFRAFYGRIEAAQTLILKPRLETWLRILMLAKDGPTKGQEPDGWAVVFPPLWQMTPAEVAEIRSKTAQTDQVYIMNGVLSPEEVRSSRFRPEGFSAETIVDDDMSPLDDLETEPEPEPPPPPPPTPAPTPEPTEEET